MKNKEKLLNTFPDFEQDLKTRLKDEQYAQLWLKSAIEDYSIDKDINALVINLKPLIEAKYTICGFSKLIGIHRITLYKIFSNKIIPSITILTKIFNGLGYELTIDAKPLKQLAN